MLERLVDSYCESSCTVYKPRELYLSKYPVKRPQLSIGFVVASTQREWHQKVSTPNGLQVEI